MFKKFLFLSILFLSLFSLFSKTEKTQNEEEKSMFTEEIEVVGKIALNKTIQSVTVFKFEDIEKFEFDNLKLVLNQTPGLLTLSTGQFGQTSSTYIRGSKPTQVLYIIDGIKLRDNANIGGVNLAVLSTDLLNKIEIVRGPMSNLYGSDAMGGVINISTYSKEGTKFVASTGNHNSYSSNFSISKPIKDFNLGLSVNFQRFSDNIENDIFKNTGISTKVGYKNQSIEIGLRFFGNFTNSGIPFNTGISTPNRNYKQDYYIISLPFTYKFNQNSKLNVKLSFNNSKYDFEDPDDLWSPLFKTKFNNYEAEVIFNTVLFNKLMINTGIDLSNQSVSNENNYGKILDHEKTNYFSGYINAIIDLNNLLISTSLRYDKYKDVDSNISPQIGFSYLAFNKLKIHASYSQSFKAPLILQQINPWGKPNFDLDPEKGKSFEIGTDFYSGKFIFSATYFNTKYKDMIDWVTVDWTTYTGQYRNIKEADVYGIELSTNFKPFKNLSIYGAYTFLLSEDKETGEELPRKPKHTVSASIIYTHKKFTFAANMVYVGKRDDFDFTVYPPKVETPSFNTYSLTVSVPLNIGLSIFGKITNLFDKEYEEIVGYPSPGRRFQIGIRYKIN
jgi:vitamin B12 transporter